MKGFGAFGSCLIVLCSLYNNFCLRYLVKKIKLYAHIKLNIHILDWFRHYKKPTNC